MSEPLATVDDVAALWPSLDPSDTATENRVKLLIGKASARLRQRVPWVDDRIAKFEVNPADPGGLNPDVVADVVATIVKRFLTNPSGATNESQTIGAYSRSFGYALRGDKDIRGELYVTDADIAALTPPEKSEQRLASIRVSPTLAPLYGYTPEGQDPAVVAVEQSDVPPVASPNNY